MKEPAKKTSKNIFHSCESFAWQWQSLIIFTSYPTALYRLYRLKIASNAGNCLALNVYFPSTGSIIMYGALLLFESEFVHIVAISFTSLILTELLMVALTIQTWHWLMIVGELLSLACYVASLVFLHEFIGERTQTRASPRPLPSHTR